MIVRNCRAGWTYHQLLIITLRLSETKRTSICRLGKRFRSVSLWTSGSHTGIYAVLSCEKARNHDNVKAKFPVFFSHSSCCNCDEDAAGSFLAPPWKFKGCLHQPLLKEELFCIHFAKKMLGNALFFLLWEFQNVQDFS